MSSNFSQRSWDFMINEYNAMRDFRELIINQVDNRVNTYLKLISASIALIPAFSFLIVNSNNTIDYRALCAVSIVISVLLFGFGILSFYRVIEGHISIIYYTRAINRARRYFYDKDNNIKNYISMPINDDVPEFGTYGFSSVKTTRVGATSLVLSLNVLNALLLQGLLIWMLSLFVSLDIRILAAFGVIALILSFIYKKMLERKYNKRMIAAEQKSQVRFPS